MTRFRLVAPPMVLATINPARPGPPSPPSRYKTMKDPVMRVPRRTTLLKSRGLTIRRARESTVGFRPRVRCGPCGDVPTRWRDPHACACEGGNRGPSRGDGCSVGRCACSLCSPITSRFTLDRTARKTVATRPTRQRYALVPSSVKLTHGQHAPSSCIYPQESIPSESYPQLDSEQATGVKSS